MKYTGIIRQIDNLGRIVLPKELRRIFDLDIDDSVEFFSDEDDQFIAVRKYEPGCVFCGSCNNLVRYHDRNICGDCLKEAIAETERTAHD